MSDKIIWGEVCKKKSERNVLLSDFITVPNEYRSYSYQGEDYKSVLQKALQETKKIRLDNNLMDKLKNHIHQNYTDVELINSVDSLFFDEKDGWWPANVWKEAIYQFMTLKVKNLDVMQPAFVIGSCGLSRGIIAGLVQLGLKKVNICSPKEGEALGIINDFSKIHFETEFIFTPKDDRTLLPGVHGVVINTLDFVSDDDFLSELYYFNFLKKGGVVLDLSETPLETPFVRIARDIHASTHIGAEVLAYFDKIWVEKAFNLKIDYESYLEKVKTHLKGIQVDQEKIKKIFDEFQIN